MRFSVESWSESAEETLALHLENIHASERYKNDTPSINYEAYFQYEREKRLHCVVARGNENEVAGYCYFVLGYPPHTSTTLVARVDGMYLRPQYRRGLVGKQFIEFAISTVRPLGVSRVQFDGPFDGRFDGLMKSLGFAPTGILYGLEL